MNSMPSWRDSTSQQAQDDVDGLLNAALPFGQEMLEKHGEFFPYGMALSDDGEARMVAGYTGDEHPPSLEVLALLVDGLREQRDALRAVAIVSDLRTTESDAIRVEIEHREGASMAVLLPYSKRRLRKRVEYGELAATAAEPRIWRS
jgi:hypothetical protein